MDHKPYCEVVDPDDLMLEDPIEDNLQEDLDRQACADRRNREDDYV